MIIYFANRTMDILGLATTDLRKGFTISEDLKVEEIETGVDTFEGYISFDKETRLKVETCVSEGNYILRNCDNKDEFYTIVEVEIDTKKQRVYFYAENNGLDLINEIVGAYEATEAQPISHYINKFAYDSGFKIKVNEVSTLTRKLKFDSEQTVTERLASVASQFDDCEISYSFKIKGLKVVNKYINIYEKRGKNDGVQLRLNKEVNSIVTMKTIANVATALLCEGGTPDDADDPITLSGYIYDDGDYFVDKKTLYSRKALEKWGRYVWEDEPNQILGNHGHIVRPFSYDTTSQETLCKKAISELKKVQKAEVNYEVDIKSLPKNTKIGDTVYIVDDAGELYLSSRILKLETSVCDKTIKATLGDFLLKKSGISAKVATLAANFAKQAVSVERAVSIARNATAIAEAAQVTANAALAESENAIAVSDEAMQAAEVAEQSAVEATEKAEAAVQAVDKVETSVESLEITVANAQAAADAAYVAAGIAKNKAEVAEEAAENAKADAEEAKAAAENAETKSAEAIGKAETAIDTADTAKETAEEASGIAASAKADSATAINDIEKWADDLTTYKQTVEAEYSRKTELTETTANLQAQITANVNELTVVHEKVTNIDETVNDAAEIAEQAQQQAEMAQQQADEATAAANAAQAEADTAKAAAETAQAVASKADSDLADAKADLATVSSRVDATEEEIAAAQQAVTEAQAAADKAQADATVATEKATTAQTTADAAAENANNAQTTADNAAQLADIAQQVANEAQGDATIALQTANEAQNTATEAQNTANTAVANAEAAQTTANTAAETALRAQQMADEADATAQQAAADLVTAQENLTEVISKVDATEEEVAAAQQAVTEAQAAADKAKEEAEAAQATADAAKTDADNAQKAADEAKDAADRAQEAADAAQAAADKAQDDVDALSIKVTKAETDIKKNSELIALTATKEEVTQTLGGYYTKSETDAAITVKANAVTSTVRSEMNSMQIGGRNLVSVSKIEDSRNVKSTQSFEIRNAWATVFINAQNLASILSPSTTYTVRYEMELIERTTVPTPFDTRAGFLIYKEGTWIDIGTYEFTKSAEVGAKVVVQHTFTTPDAWNGEQLICYSRRWTTEGSDPVGFDAFRVTNFKIERGIKATDWTPAPEEMATGKEVENIETDYNSKIDVLESKVEQLALSIISLVRGSDGLSRMTQTATETELAFFSTDAIDAALAELDEKYKKENATIEELQQALAEQGERVKISTYEDEPCIILYENDSNYKQIITNTRRIIMQTVGGIDTVLSITDYESSKTKRVIATQAAKVGGYVLKTLDDGCLVFDWEGAIE